jgi:hypothetical protein
VRKIQNAHHAENQREPRTQHKKQQPIAQSIEHGDDEELHKKLPYTNHGKPHKKRRAQPPEERALLKTHFN